MDWQIHPDLADVVVDDDLEKIARSYAQEVARRMAQKKARRPGWRGSGDRARRAKAANQMRAPREEAARRTEERCTKTRANHFAWVMLIAGSSYHTLMMVLSFLGVWVPPQSTVYTAQRGMVELLRRLALASCARQRAFLRPNNMLGFDCAWSHGRRVSHASSRRAEMERTICQRPHERSLASEYLRK
jgi:hypothetical protein